VLGETLRSRRQQRGLELDDAAAELGVPAKSLRALEWDRPDLLGSPAEAEHLHLRYAAFLGLGMEGLTSATGAVVEPAVVEPTVAEPTVAAPRPKDRSRRAVWLPALAALAPAVVIGVVFVVGRTGEGESAPEGDREPSASSVVSKPEPGVGVTSDVTVDSEESPAPPPRRSRVELVVTADGGASWVEAHSDSATGPLLFQGTLESGRELRLAGRRIWLRLGAASNVSLALNGRSTPTELFGTVDVLVTPQGIQPVG
jgi:cytoskeleton protein RodZ